MARNVMIDRIGFGVLPNPRTILTNNDVSYTNFVPRIEPPDEDDISDESPLSSAFENRTNETMKYRAYYGMTDSQQQQVFAPLDARGFSSTNVSFLGDPNEEGDGLWSEGRKSVKDRIVARDTTTGSSDTTTTTTTTTPAGDVFVPSTFDEATLDNRSANKRTKGKSKGGTQGPNNSNWSLSDVDPFGGGRSFLLRELKAKFIELSTPLTKFVTRYCALSGVTDTNKSLHHYIQVRSLFTRAEENNDWEGLINSLYGGGGGGGGGGNNSNGSFGNDGNSGLDTSELADAILQMIADEGSAARKLNDGNSTDVTREQANRMIRTNEAIQSRTAAMLRRSYNNMATGKVVFLLDPILRESAQSLLDVINENYRGSYSKPNFTLLEIMRSSAVMTTFIKLMLISKQTSNMLGVVPITPNPYSGIYGTLGDRISAGGKDSGRAFGGSGYSSLTVVQSRPTVANMVAGSMEYNAGLKYFATVEKARDGSGGLVSVDPLKRKYEEKETNSTEREEMYFDSQSKTYKRRKFDSRGRQSESSDSWFTSNDNDNGGNDYSSNSGGRQQKRRKQLPSKPIETIQDALSRNAVYNEYPTAFERYYNPKVLSYRDQDGQLKLVSKRILSDIRALTHFYSTGKVGSYHVDSY